MAHCCVPGCNNSHSKNVRMFSFPADEMRRSLWEKRINREQGWKCKSSRICKHHFREEFIIKSGDNIYLQKNAVPTIFPTTPAPIKFKVENINFVTSTEVPCSSQQSQIVVQQIRPNNPQDNFSDYIKHNIDLYFNTQTVSNDEENITTDAFNPEEFFTVDVDLKCDDEKRKLDELSLSFDSLKLDFKKTKLADLSQTSVSSNAVSDNSVSSLANIESSISVSDLSTTVTTTGTTEELIATIKKIKLKLKDYKRKLKKIITRNTNTMKKYKAAVKRFSRAEKKKKEITHSDVLLKKVFNEDQITALGKNSTRGMEWSNETIELGLKLKFSCGSTGYGLLIKNNLPLPSISTLNRRLENLKFDTGILHEVMEFLSKKVMNMVENEKDCCLLLDEMKISECREFDQANNKFFGNITYPAVKNEIASDALVFQLGGISSRWKQVIAYEFTGKTLDVNDGEVLKSTIVTLIQKCESLGLKVHAVTSDMGGKIYLFN